jgi:hypothetical protein
LNRDERRWFLALSGLLMILTSLPYLAGFASQGEEWTFSGFVFGVGDGNSYIAKMLQGATGAWLFRTPYSAHPGPGIVAFLPYLLLGKLAAGDEIHLQLVLLYHVARLAMIPLAVVATYRFASLFLVERTWRQWATVLAALGGGLGWLLVLTGQADLMGSLPLDFYSPETFGFLAFYGLPHLLLAKALMLLALASYLRSSNGLRNGVLAGVLLLALGLVQPLTVLSAYAAIGAHLALLTLTRLAARAPSSLGSWFRSAAVAVGISLPVVGYYVAATRLNPAVHQWAAQNVLPSPHPIHYLIGYALVLAPAVVGARDLVRREAALGWFLPAWFAALIALAYAPVSFQRRLADGAWVALAILAARGLSTLRLSERGRRVVAAVLLAASLGTTLILIGGGFSAASWRAIPLYRPEGEVRAMSWLRDHAEGEAVVLASFDTGNVLPAWAPVRSVIGHGPETANLAEVQPKVERFFGDAMSDGERQALLREQSVDFVFLGPLERALGSWTSVPRDLVLVYDEGGYAVYAVAEP